jgi:hypothetical protein
MKPFIVNADFVTMLYGCQKVDGFDVRGMRASEVRALLAGPPGSQVEVHVRKSNMQVKYRNLPCRRKCNSVVLAGMAHTLTLLFILHSVQHHKLFQNVKLVGCTNACDEALYAQLSRAAAAAAAAAAQT